MTLKLTREDLVLLCPNGGTAPLDQWEKCNLGFDTPRVFVSSGGKSANVLEELTHGIITSTSIYSMRPDLLQIFGIWAGERNILFKVNIFNLKINTKYLQRQLLFY